MFDVFDNESFGNFGLGIGLQPPYQRTEACGFDATCYISTASLVVVPYTGQNAVLARFGSLADVIAATDDDNTGVVDTTIFDQTVTNVTQEINGYLSSIYPVPLAKTGTVAVLKVTAVDSDGAITAVEMLTNGGYQVAPSTTNSPAYLRYINPLAYQNCWGWNWNISCQNGTGASLTVVFTTPTAVTPQTPIMVTGTPTIADGGTGYEVNSLLVLTGGSSFVPDKVLNAACLMVCYELARRRLVPDEKNNFYSETKRVKQELLEIGNGEKVMDGTYRDFYSPVTAMVQQSVLLGNSL
jgi:hypothetical protein